LQGAPEIAGEHGMEAKALLELMYAQAEDQALILMNSEGVVIEWMMGASRIFGRAADSMIGGTLHCLFTAEDQAAKVPENELANAVGAGTGADDRWMVRSDGAVFWASGFVQCLRAADGRVIGFAKLLRDRTDIRAQIETLRNRAELLADEDRRKLLLFGTLAHELRTPFAAIGNAVELLERAYPNDQKLEYAVQILKRQTRYVNSLVDDLEEVVRARTGKTVLHYELIPLDALLADVAATIRPALDAKRQQISLLMPPTSIEIEGDPVRLRQAFLNLLQNASKFSDRDKKVFVTCTVEAEEAVVRIEDQGRGISAMLLPRVFDALTQAELTAEGHAPLGLGLGLSLVKEYVELHGGSVQVRSEGLGRGSEFTVRLPLLRRAERFSVRRD
jgi:two-component system CheB/CheR fusion protein